MTAAQKKQGGENVGGMKKFFMWIREQRERVWFSAAVNLLLLTILLLLFGPSFETNDDAGISNMISGVKGGYDAHLIYSNYLLGVILETLYRNIPLLPWYVLLQYALLFVSFTVITAVLIRRMKQTLPIWAAGILIVFFSYEGYIRVQYTKTAAILTVAGILMMFYGLTREKLRKTWIISGILLACTGSLYRFQQFGAECALMTGIGVSFLFWLGKQEKGKKLCRLGACVISFGVLVAVSFGLYRWDRSLYQAEEWQEYMEYNDARTELYDYGFPPYAEYKDKYKELGFNQNAFQLLMQWNHMDTEKFTTEAMQEIAQWKTPRQFSLDTLKQFFKEFPRTFLDIPSFYCFLLVLLYWIFWGCHRRENMAVLLYEAAAAGMIYLFLFYMGRYLMNRVDSGIWLAVSLVVLWQFPSEKCRLENRAAGFLLLAFICLFQNTWSDHWRVNTEKEAEKRLDEKMVLEEISSDTEHLYLAPVGNVSLTDSYGLWERAPYGILENLYSLGGWTAKSPLFMKTLEKFGISNPFRDMIGNDDVYLITTDQTKILKYIRRYYKQDAKAVKVRKLGKYTVYQIR